VLVKCNRTDGLSNVVIRALRFARPLCVLAAFAALGCGSEGPTLPADVGPSTGGAAASGGSGGASGGSGGANAAGHAGTGGNAGSGAAGMSGATGPGTFNDVAAIMARNCGASLCHGGGVGGQPLVYTNKATLYATLTTTVVAECMNSKLVTPGDPAHSALLLLPTWMCTDASGGPFVMPQSCIDDPCLTQPELDSIKTWIMKGAPQ
jgi:hypothetical protein